MHRREALFNLGIISGLAFLGSSSLLTACSNIQLKEYLDDSDVQLLNEIGDIIVPATPGLPGAKAADTGKYIQIMVQDCMSEEKRKDFMRGWQQIQVLGKEKYDAELAKLSNEEKLTYLTSLDKYTPIGGDRNNSDLAISTFQTIKQLTLKGYFTSEIGATQALRYDPVPGKFVGNIAYKPGDKVWAISM